MKKLLTALLAVLLLSSVLSVGSFSAADESPPCRINFSKEAAKLQEGEDLAGTLSCGLSFDPATQPVPPESVTAQITMMYSKWTEAEEFAIVEKFVLREFEDFSNYIPPYTEAVTIPADKFSSSAGSVSWLLKVTITYAEDSGLPQEHYGVNAKLCYRKFDREIQLYDGEYEFRQSYQTGCNQTLFAW